VVRCEPCINALETSNYISKLTTLKKNEDALIGLQEPSQDLIDICKLSESQILLLEKCGKPNSINIMIEKKMSYPILDINVLTVFPINMFDEVFEGNRIIALIKLIFKFYVHVRLHHHNTNKLNELTIGSRVRSMLTNSIIFKGQ
jgi:hypothetical protein